MRLTLRTILAYIDDVLEPAQAREIGEKIAEGKEASALVSRIQDVLRRRRIGAPELTGPGSGPDPNIVSDYLENLLSPNEVVELERLCQKSDIHLAEVAGCHKILTLVLGQPIDVSDEIRERMYALGNTSVSGSEAAPLPPSQAMSEGVSVADADFMETGLPAYLTRRSYAKSYGAAALILVVTLGWILLVVNDHRLWDRPEAALARLNSEETTIEEALPAGDTAAPADGNVNSNPVPTAVPTAVPAAAPIPVPGTVPATVAKSDESPSASVSPETPKPVETTPPVAEEKPAMPVAVAPVSPPVVAPVPGATPGTQPLPNAPVPMPPGTVVVPVEPLVQPVPPELVMTYLAGDELILQPHVADPGWAVSGRELPVENNATLASPSPFRNSYRIGDSLTLTMYGKTRIQRLSRTPDVDFGLLLDCGQITLFRSYESTAPVTVRVRVLGRDWTLALLEPGTRVGIELDPLLPNGPPGDMAEVTIEGGVVVAEGKVSVRTPGGPVVEYGPRHGYARWPSTGTGQLVTKVDPTVPDWATAEGPFVTPAARQFGRLFHKEFNPAQSVETSIVPLLKDRRAGLSELAAKTLALIGDWKDLVPALKNDHQETRLAAIYALRNELAKNPGSAGAIREELGRNFPTEKVEPLIRLLWGFNAEDARRPGPSLQLVEWLKDDEIAIRELAFHYISKLTARTHDYLPMAPATERKATVYRWEEYLKRNGGALISDPGM